MAVIIPNEGERTILNALKTSVLNPSPFSSIRLFQGGGAVTVDASIDAATLNAAEADYSGYAAVQRYDWTTAVTDGSGNAYITCSSVSFQHSGGGTANTIYGWYLLDNAGNLVMCEEFGSPITMDDALDIITITPKLFGSQAP